MAVLVVGSCEWASVSGQMWVHQPAVSTAAAQDSWVEVLHCANEPSGKERLLTGWKYAPAWFYAAPGSGVSINVGRTRVVASWTTR